MTMGDRIAVMSHGVLQQVGTPEELYTNPANVFVAGFIGSPSMNLVPAGIVEGVGRSGDIVGVRPEHFQLGNGKPGHAHVNALVEVVEYLGDEQLAHLKVRDTLLVAKLPVDPRLEAGQQLDFSVPLQKVRLFDAETQSALPAPA